MPELRFIASEIRLVFRRRRNQILLLLLALLPVVIALAIRSSASGSQQSGGSGTESLFDGANGNGLLVAFASLAAVMSFLLPLTLAVVAGDSVAGEAALGTLRYLLIRPVGRWRLLVAKYVGIALWCLVAPLVVALAGVLIGVTLFGGGDVLLLSGTTVSMPNGLLRLAAVVGYVAVMLAGVGAVGLFISTLTEVPVAAMAATLAFVVASEVLDAIAQLSWLHPWLPTHGWLWFTDLLREPVFADRMERGVGSALAYAVIFLSLAWARFAGKDVTS